MPIPPLWVRFLWTSLRRSLDSAGRADVVGGLLVFLAGRIVNVDLAVPAAIAVLVVLLIQVFVLTPAAMWDEERQKRRARGIDGFNVTVESGGILNIYQDTSSVDVAPLHPSASIDAADASSSGAISRSAPRSRRTSKRGPTDPPSSRAS